MHNRYSSFLAVSWNLALISFRPGHGTRCSAMRCHAMWQRKLSNRRSQLFKFDAFAPFRVAWPKRSQWHLFAAGECSDFAARECSTQCHPRISFLGIAWRCVTCAWCSFTKNGSAWTWSMWGVFNFSYTDYPSSDSTRLIPWIIVCLCHTKLGASNLSYKSPPDSDIQICQQDYTISPARILKR